MVEDKEKKAQELYMEFQVIDKHIKQLQQQLELVTSQFMELNATNRTLDEFTKIEVGKEIFVPLSSGIFAKASIKDSSELLVNVGANVAVNKDIPSTKKIIQNQIEEVKKVQKHMVEQLERMTTHAAQLEKQLHDLVSEG
ncbi:prefoldin subunit alpha [Candidatus Woesearchaeota archaeon]|nr:prefoldin subunit alpha [Candidatus Woesearchaeota archaeon]